MNICENGIYGQKMKNIGLFLLILCPNMDIIRPTIYDFSALKKKKKKIFKKTEKTLLFFNSAYK
jgi:hypothetical protein